MVSDPIQGKRGPHMYVSPSVTPSKPMQSTGKSASESIAERFWAPLFPTNKPSKQQMKVMLDNLLKGLMTQVRRDLAKAKKALAKMKRQIEGDD